METLQLLTIMVGFVIWCGFMTVVGGYILDHIQKGNSMTALVNFFKLLLPRSSKPVEKEAQEIYQRKYVEINLKPFLKPKIHGVQVTKARVDMKLTQTELAQMLGVRQSTVSSWENSRVMPSPESIKKLKEITGKRRSYFFRG